MYFVVKFEDGNDVAVVPESWCAEILDGKKLQVAGPPCRDPVTMNNLVKDNASPLTSWKRFIAKKLGSSRM